MKEELFYAFKKLKAYLLHDKTLLAEKIALAEFEENFSSNIEELERALKSSNIQKYLEAITYTLNVKKLGPKQLEKNIYLNNLVQDKYDVESYNVFIKAPIQIHLISMLWSMNIGEQLDREKENQFVKESYKLFQPYYGAYYSYRDDAISMALTLHKQKLNVSVVNLDIQEFYYHIAFDFAKDIPKDIEDKYNLNTFMQQIHQKFHQVVEKLHPNSAVKNYDTKKFLPIGLVSSAIIANYVLKELDKDIVENLQPEYYGRYVDDMLFVFSNKKFDAKVKDIVCSFFKCLFSECFFKTRFVCRNGRIWFKTDNRIFQLKQEKLKFFQFNKDDSIAILKKFKTQIDEDSSFFKFLPNKKDLFETLESAANKICYEGSEHTFISLDNLTKDKLAISRNLVDVVSIVSSAKFENNYFNNYNKQLLHVFYGRNIIELQIFWQRVFEYLYIIENKELFKDVVKFFLEAIKELKYTQQTEKLVADTKEYFLNSIKFALALDAEEKVKKLIDELELEISLEDVKKIKEANVFTQSNMSFPLINFCENTKNIDFLTHNIDFKDFEFCIDYNKIKRSARFIHYHEIAFFYFLERINAEIFGSFDEEILEKINKDFEQWNHLGKQQLPLKKDNIFEIDAQEKLEKNKLKIAIVSIKINIEDIESSSQGKPNLEFKRVLNIFNTLNDALKDKNNIPDIIVFPEVSISYAWIHLVARFAKKNNIGVVFGVEHIVIGKKVFNYSCVMLPFDIDNHTSLFVNFDLKRHYAPVEKKEIEAFNNQKIYQNINKTTTQLYRWRGAVFSTINCFELTDISLRMKLKGKIDFLIAIEYNRDTNYFSNIIESSTRDIHCYIVQVNTSDYGDSRIIQPTKTEKKDIVKLKGGENVYLVMHSIDIQKLRDFQKREYCGTEKNLPFKLLPPNFIMDESRKK